jgi:hypothetical protein
MRKILALAWFLFLSTSVFAQTVGKTLAFPQVAAGGGWKTVLNLTNRGTTAYSGSLKLSNMSPTNQPQPWSPIVNGNLISNGQMNFSINPGVTLTLTITEDGGTQAGFGTITPVTPSDSEQSSLVEGTLTYYVISNGIITDSIGILPSDQIYLASLPFDDFSTIALAMANTNSTAASVHLTLFSAANQMVGTHTELISANGYVATYAGTFFPNAQVTGGRLEIQSDTPIIGTALTDTSGQFSSLPFASATKSYSWSTTLSAAGGGGSQTLTGTAVVRVHESSVIFESIQLTKNGQPVQKPFGTTSGMLRDGALILFILDTGNNVAENFEISPFSFSMPTASGVGQVYSIDPAGLLGTGQITITATN